MIKRFFHVLESILIFSAIMFVINYFWPNDNVPATHEVTTSTSSKKPDKSNSQIKQNTDLNSPDYVPDKITTHSESYMGEDNQHTYNHRNISIYDGTHSDDLHKAVAIAINNWNQNGTVLFYLTDNKNADIRLGQKSLRPRIEGVTQQWVNDKTQYTSYSLTNFDYQQMQKYAPQIENSAKVVEHELGHAVGLDHVKKYSIMRTGSNDYDLTQDDFNRVKRLYQNKPMWKDREFNK